MFTSEPKQLSRPKNMKEPMIIHAPIMEYAGFWKRFAAATIDGVILACACALIKLSIGDPVAWLLRPEASLLQLVLTLSLPLAICWSYWSGFESSPLQATPGKLAVGIYVTDLHGHRLDFTAASARFFGKMLSALLLGVGFLMAATTSAHQALHDRISGCLVLSR